MLATIDAFITPARARVAAYVLLAIYLATTAVWLITTRQLTDAFHQPISSSSTAPPA